jgi:hypothetical protein
MLKIGLIIASITTVLIFGQLSGLADGADLDKPIRVVDSKGLKAKTQVIGPSRFGDSSNQAPAKTVPGIVKQTVVFPTFAQVESIVSKELRRLPKYRSGDILSQDQVEPIFARLKNAGWPIRDSQSILNRVLPDGSFLVRSLRTKKGLAFAQQMARIPNGYDRLDHLSKLSTGRETIDHLIKTPKGYELIEYMATTSGGKKLGRILKRTPNGADFNRQTGRIYTERQLLTVLEQLYKSDRP